MSIDEVYKLCQYLVNKYRQGYLSPDEFNSLFNLSQNTYFTDLIGSVDKYTPGHPLDVHGKMYNQTMQEMLSPFFTTSSVNLPGNSRISKPANFGSLIDILDASNRSINQRPQNKLVGYLTDSIDPINTDHAIAIDAGSFWQVYPVSGWGAGTTLTINYYKLPPDAKWAYTLDSNGLPVYNAGNSVQPIWRENEYNELVARTISLVGINLSNPQVIQYSELQKKED